MTWTQHCNTQHRQPDNLTSDNQTHLLNCLLAGDKEDQVFNVKILKTDNVSILGDLIKEKKKHHFGHLDATDLELWNVSFPIDRLASEEPPAKGPKLRPTSKVSSLAALSEEHVHILVKAPGQVATPEQLLSLNCFVLGDDMKEGFTIKIPKTNNVSILKKMIKEEKKPSFDNVTASKLIISQVSLPMDDDLEESLKNINLTPLNPFLPLWEVFHHVEGDHLHIVVQAPINEGLDNQEAGEIIFLP
ncbi:hypothetical protein APHAL10511_004240 [Amanita phalloides]|nr:hypothetical protein APHAL10511_004240 [Amanita phalloides]